MSGTSIRTLLVITLALGLVGLAAATWARDDHSIAPIPRVRAPLSAKLQGTHHATSDGVTVATRAFETSDDAQRFFTDVVNDLGRNDSKLLAGFCPLEVPGAVEVVLGHGHGMRETILLLTDGTRVHRVSRLDPPGVPESDVHQTIVAATRGLITR